MTESQKSESLSLILNLSESKFSLPVIMFVQSLGATATASDDGDYVLVENFDPLSIPSLDEIDEIESIVYLDKSSH